MKVLVAEDEAVARLTLTRLLERQGYEVATATTGTEALALALAEDAPRMILLDWMMPGVDGVEICRRLRARAGAPYTYIVMVSGRCRQQDVLEAMEAGVDEFVAKPFDLMDLGARVRVGERVLARSNPSTHKVRDVLREALASPGGEVIVRQGDAVGRIHLVGGRVAWAHLSTEPGSILDVLANEAPLSREDVVTAIQEARTTRRSVGDILVEWELVEPERLRDAFHGWISKKLTAILALEDPSVVFVPQTAPSASGQPTFAFAEVSSLALADEPGVGSDNARALRPVSTPAPRVEPERALQHAVHEAHRLEGSLVAAALDVRVGMPLALAGDETELDLELARAQLRVMALVRAADEASADDLILTTARRLYITRCVPSRPGLVLCLVMERDAAILGFARMTLKSIADAVVPA